MTTVLNTGTITVHKTVDDGDEPVTSFCFTLDPDPAPAHGEVCADGAGDAVFDDVIEGTYDVDETSSPSTYHEVSNDCTGLAIVNQGDNLTCDVHNTINQDMFQVRKVWQPLDGRQVLITVTCSPDAIVTNLDPTAGQFDPADFVIRNYDAGTVCTATETVPAGFTSNQLDCANFHPEDGDCTIINRQGAEFPTFTPVPSGSTSSPPATPTTPPGPTPTPRPTRTPKPASGTSVTAPQALGGVF
jgi:hypothetical protein